MTLRTRTRAVERLGRFHWAVVDDTYGPNGSRIYRTVMSRHWTRLGAWVRLRQVRRYGAMSWEAT
jgi:hypothetical protein